MFETFGERRAVAVREITKIHEESVPFTLAEGLAGEKRGEYVLVVEGAGEGSTPTETFWADMTVPDHVAYYVGQGMTKKDAIKAAAKDRGVPKNEVYQQVLD